MIFVLFVHEIFHIFFIKLFKQKISKFELTAFGGMMNVKVNATFIEELLIYSGGIIGNVIIFILLFVFRFPNTETIYNYNKLMILINILPIFPLDGAKILELIFEKIFPTRKALKIIFLISLIFLFLFIVYSMIIRSLPFMMMAILLIYHNICFFKSFDDIILNRIFYDIKRGKGNAI